MRPHVVDGIKDLVEGCGHGLGVVPSPAQLDGDGHFVRNNLPDGFEHRNGLLRWRQK